jgi:hypothetical protein
VDVFAAGGEPAAPPVQGSIAMGPAALIAAQAIPAGINFLSGLFGNRAQTRINQQSLAQQLQMFREQQAFLQAQAEQDRLQWESQQAEDQRRYDQMMGLQKEQWEAQQRLRAPYREASQRILGGAFGDGTIRPYPGATLGQMLQRG